MCAAPDLLEPTQGRTSGAQTLPCPSSPCVSLQKKTAAARPPTPVTRAPARRARPASKLKPRPPTDEWVYAILKSAEKKLREGGRAAEAGKVLDIITSDAGLLRVDGQQ